MPTIWKYVLGRYGQVLMLCAVSFIVLMLVLRLEEIARFATQSGEWTKVALFMLYQIPYIVPMALPIACMVAAMIVMRSFSDSAELTALRAAGLSITQVMTPMILGGAALVMLNFYFTSELTPICRQKSRELIFATTAQNPLYLLQKHKHLRIDDVDVDMKIVQPSQHVKDLVLVMYQPDQERLGAIFASDLKLKDGDLKGKNVSVVGSLSSPDGFDHLVIENEQRMVMPSTDLALMLHRSKFKQTYDSLSLKAMLKRAKSELHLAKNRHRFQFELIRRTSFGIAPLSFTFVGAAFGIQIGRRRNKRALFLAAGLAALMLTSILVGKSFESMPWMAGVCYLAIHPVAALTAWKYKMNKEQGRE